MKASGRVTLYVLQLWRDEIIATFMGEHRDYAAALRYADVRGFVPAKIVRNSDGVELMRARGL